jgi:hypothetical protein
MPSDATRSPKAWRMSPSPRPRMPRNALILETPHQALRRQNRPRERRTIRVDRAVPESDHTSGATRTKAQVRGSDEYSAPTRSRRHAKPQVNLPGHIFRHPHDSGESRSSAEPARTYWSFRKTAGQHARTNIRHPQVPAPTEAAACLCDWGQPEWRASSATRVLHLSSIVAGARSRLPVRLDFGGVYLHTGSPHFVVI